MLPLKKNDPRRIRRQIKRHALLLLRATCAATICTLAWHSCWARGWHLAEDDNEVIIGAIIMMFGVIFSVIMSWVFPPTWEKYQKFVDIVFTRDKDAYMKLRDERMPIAFHLLIGAASVPPVVMIAVVAYRHAVTGALSVFSTSFVIAMLWLVLDVIENPMRSTWFRTRIPEQWALEDVDEYWAKRWSEKIRKDVAVHR